jgi:hypothetical protein
MQYIEAAINSEAAPSEKKAPRFRCQFIHTVLYLPFVILMAKEHLLWGT